MKRAIIVHCWEGYPEYCWYPRAKQQLEARGFEVKIPSFPETEKPQQNKWVPYLAQQIGQPDENIFLIGHSIGCIAILRYLETLPAGQQVGGAVLVAGFTNDIGFKELKNFFQTPIDFKKIRSKSKKGFIVIHSDNDPYVDLKYADIFKKELGAEVIVKHAMGHFSGAVENEPACTELPEVAESVKKLAAR